ncbi:hypothetical protein OROMI_021861 [Orobanche minor]
MYSKGKKGGWQLVSNDRELLEIVQGCDHGEEVEFYIDNTIDKDIQPLIQMQPHVIVRLRETLFQVSAKKQQKRKFVTTHQLRQQQLQQQLHKKTRMSPRLNKCNQEDATVKDKVTARRKLDLHTSDGAKIGENEVVTKNPPLTQYEKDRISRLKKNDEKLEELGIRPLLTSLRSFDVHNSNIKSKVDEEYHPEEEVDVQSDDMSERSKVVEKKKLAHGPRTRSRANITATVKDATRKDTTRKDATRKESRKAGTEKDNEVTSSYRPPALKPTCSKVLKHGENGVAPGSVTAYLALRECQKNNIEVPPSPYNAPELNLEESTTEVVKAAPRKPRGRTKMAKVFARSANDKVVITLNEDDQPVSDNQKIITELANYVGTLARDNVSLTYVNWRVVPANLKTELWECVRAKYVIPDEAKKWVYTTLNDAWRGYKSRTKVLGALANDNSERRCSITDTHTMGPKSLAQVKNKMKKCDPKQGTPSDANVFVETRKQKAGRKYKTNTAVLEKKMENIKKQLNSGNQAEADAMVSHDKEHGRNWLVGRGGKSSGTKVHASSSHYVDELTTKIKLDLETELEAKVNKKVQENLTWVLKKLSDANPDLKLDIGEFCVTVSSEDDNGTPMTKGGPTS